MLKSPDIIMIYSSSLSEFLFEICFTVHVSKGPAGEEDAKTRLKALGGNVPAANIDSLAKDMQEYNYK